MSDRTVEYYDRGGHAARVAYTRTGRGTPVVLIHGVGLRGAVWQPQVDALAAAHDVIAVDMPGHGGSSLPPPDAGLPYYADAVLTVLDALGVGRAHLAGHSMGALVALELALAQPGRMRSLVAMNAVFCRTPEGRAAIAGRVAALRGGAAKPDWDATLERWFGNPAPAPLQEVTARVRAMLDAVDPVGYERTYALFARADAEHRDRLPLLPCPALFFTGEHDPNSTPAMSEAMARAAPDGRALILSGAKHMMGLTDADRVKEVLRSWFAEVDHQSGHDGAGQAAATDLARSA